MAADGGNNERTKVDNYLAVITHFNQCDKVVLTFEK